MDNKTLEIRTSINIQRPAEDVYEAIVDPLKMSNYFIETSTGRMKEGKTVTWKFPEFDMSFLVEVEKTEEDKYISFLWESQAGNKTLVDISLTKKSENDTYIVVTEKSAENNEDGIKWLKSNTAGWANFLACLKAYLEYGINLRRGAFDPVMMKN